MSEDFIHAQHRRSIIFEHGFFRMITPYTGQPVTMQSPLTCLGILIEMKDEEAVRNLLPHCNVQFTVGES